MSKVEGITSKETARVVLKKVTESEHDTAQQATHYQPTKKAAHYHLKDDERNKTRPRRAN